MRSLKPTSIFIANMKALEVSDEVLNKWRVFEAFTAATTEGDREAMRKEIIAYWKDIDPTKVCEALTVIAGIRHHTRAKYSIYDGFEVCGCGSHIGQNTLLGVICPKCQNKKQKEDRKMRYNPGTKHYQHPKCDVVKKPHTCTKGDFTTINGTKYTVTDVTKKDGYTIVSALRLLNTGYEATPTYIFSDGVHTFVTAALNDMVGALGMLEHLKGKYLNKM